MMKVFLCESIHPAALKRLQERAELISDWADIGEADAIINRNLKLPEEVLRRCENLKVIAIHGTGCDGIDMAYCAGHGITVLYVPYENADSVAELIVALTLTLLRNLHLADRLLLSGAPLTTAPPELFGGELAGKTVGLVGTGDIARRAARIFREGFRAEVIGFSPSLSEEKAARLGIGFCPSLTDLLRRADIVSIGTHLTASTANLIGEKELALMKPSAILINTARGGIVDEAALCAALRAGTIAAAACDVFALEPPSRENPLVGLPNFMATPHLGANTDEALRRVGVKMVDELFTVLDGGKAAYTYE